MLLALSQVQLFISQTQRQIIEGVFEDFSDAYDAGCTLSDGVTVYTKVNTENEEVSKKIEETKAKVKAKSVSSSKTAKQKI